MTARSQNSPTRRPSRRHRPPRLAWVWIAALNALGISVHAANRTTAPAGPACRLEVAHHPATPRGFLGYPCRDDRCTSHKAGFDWAERNGISHARACMARNDEAFTEGCRAYAEEAVTAEQAGFQWARENDLADPCLCAGGGAGFEAGCEAYIRGFAD